MENENAYCEKNKISIDENGVDNHEIEITETERLILLHMANGKDTEVIAKELGLSHHTVKFYISCFFKKTSARNRTHAVFIALKNNLLDEEFAKLKFVKCRRLNETERRMVNMIALGYMNKEIAAELYVSIHTVKTYLATIFKKLHADNRTHLVFIAFRKNLIAKNLFDN